MKVKNKIIEYSRSLDIDLIGFLKAETFDDIKEILISRKDKDYLSGFEEPDIEKRINPNLIFPEAKSIIVIGVSYNSSSELQSDEKIKGKISKSSLGADYHTVLKNKLEKLCQLIKKEINSFDYVYHVDTGPLVDRHLAFKSGIGWYGKNNCIINSTYGSWIFIGYILCNIEIEEDVPSEDKCSGCNICITNCPTGALMDNNIYNAKKCISYLTQTKEDIDYELRGKMTDYIYGCDICQLRCPHNQNVPTNLNSDFLVEGFTSEVDILELLEMSNSEFKQRFGKASMSWRGPNVIKRNALIILGNSKRPEFIEVLKKYLIHPSIMLRKYAAWAIIKLDPAIGKEIFKKHLDKEKAIEVADEIKKLIAYYG